MCGEKWVKAEGLVYPMGSPLLVRGIGCTLDGDCSLVGITPACAGKRKVVTGNHKYRGDHPRLRGEKEFPDLGGAPEMGSPPLARGKVCA